MIDRQLIDCGMERALVAAMIATPELHLLLPDEFGLDVLADLPAQHAFEAFANVSARGDVVTVESVRAELVRKLEHQDLQWFDELAALKIAADAPVLGWAATIVRIAAARRTAVQAAEPKAVNVDPDDYTAERIERNVLAIEREIEDARNADRPRREIMLTSNRPSVVDEAERAIAGLGSVYVRGRQLVRVLRDHGASDWLRRPVGAPVIVPIERDHLLELLGRAADFVVVRKDGPTVVPAPAWVAAMLSARGEWQLPQLEGIADAPVFRADGSILEIAGYDASTRIIYDPCAVSFGRVPTKPTRDDAVAALARLCDPFAEFPFVADTDRAAAIALVLSMVGRAAIDGNVPMFASQAPTPGSGKGLLVDVCATIATGRRAPLMAPTDDDDETRKRLLAIAIESPTIVVIDNVEGAIGSPALAMALTAGEVRDRVLGSTKIVTASLRPVWAMTGNNVQLKGDLGRRVVPIDLDPKVEHPEDRTFARGALLEYVRARRPELVIAALTVLRAFVVAGRPSHGMPSKGSFETWDRLIRGAIIWAGGADPLGGVQRIREQADADLDQLRALLTAWSDHLPPTGLTIAEAIRRAGDSGDLRDALTAYCPSGKPDARKLGYALRKVRGRVVNGMAMERADTDRDGATRWFVSRCG